MRPPAIRLRRRPRWTPVAAAIAPVLAAALALASCSQEAPLPFVPTPEPTPEQPREVTVRVVEAGDAAPLPGVGVEIDGASAVTDASGAAVITAMRGAEVRAELVGHDPARAAVPAEGELVLELRPNVASGQVTAADGSPIAGARVFHDGAARAAQTDEEGRYILPDVPDGATLVVKRAGFRLAEVHVGDELELDVALEPFEARALYAPSAVFEAPGRFEQLLDLIERTEVNALVVDVKETDGQLYFATDLRQAVEIGAVRETPIFDVDEVLGELHERGIYAIARMVVMKDNTMAAARPELAVRNTVDGGPWRDNIGGAWLDPSAPGVGEYISAVAGAVADAGFDEVQLDYIRWYSDGNYAVAETNLPNTQSFRLPSIGRIMRTVSSAFETRRAFLAADVFPISFIVPDDQGIGQRPEVIMPFVDYFCPMVYPSHYGPGVFGHPVPNTAPYDVIDKTLEIMNEQAEGLPIAIRPWIQDFGYGPFPPYSAAQVQAEMQAAADNGAAGWMIWNARASFTEAALGPPREGEAHGITTIDPSAASPTAPGSPAGSPAETTAPASP